MGGEGIEMEDGDALRIEGVYVTKESPNQKKI